MNQSTQTEPTIKPRDTFVEMYNELWLNIREQKNTLSQWINNLFDKVDAVEERVDDIEAQLQSIREDIIIEIRDELMREVREEMRS